MLYCVATGLVGVPGPSEVFLSCIDVCCDDWYVVLTAGTSCYLGCVSFSQVKLPSNHIIDTQSRLIDRGKVR
jgi:hypothetical protein